MISISFLDMLFILKRAHLKTASFFGSHVNKCEEYIEVAAEGNVSNIQMK
jgi:hypothetical protein